MTSERTQRFLDALHRLEERSDLAPLVRLFTDHAEIGHPIQHEPEEGQPGARRFFQQYRSTFGRIRTDMRMVLEKGDVTVLEWTAQGTCRDQRNIRYDGVSVIEFDGDRVRAFRTYFDPGVLRAHVRPEARSPEQRPSA